MQSSKQLENQTSENNKRIAKNTLFLYFRMFITLSVSLYTSRIVLDTLGIEDFGIYNVVGGIVVLFGFLSVTMASGIQRFLTFQMGNNDFEKLKTTFSTSLIINFCLAIIILILAETIGLWFLNNKMNIPADRMDAVQWVYQFSVLASLISIFHIPYNASIIAHERMNIIAYVSIVDVSLKLLVVYLLLVSSHDKLIVYSILIFMVILLINTIYRIYCINKFAECKFRFVWDKDLFQAMMSFSGWNLFGSLASTAANEGINIALNIFFGPIVNAARAISFQVNNAVIGFASNFQTAVTPQITKLYAGNKLTDLHKLLYLNAKFAFILMLFITLPVIFELETLLFWWLKSVPVNTLLFCRLVLLQSILYSLSMPFRMAIHATGKMKIINLTAGIALLMVLPVSYVLLKMGLPPYVPFIAYIGGTIAEFSFELYYLNKWINLSISSFFKNTIFPVTKVIFISVPIPAFIYYHLDKGLIQFLIVSITSSIGILGSSYFFAIDLTKRVYVRNYLSNRFHIKLK